MSSRYLPAGSKIAVKNQKNETTWYTTKEEVPVLSGDLVVADCPMRTNIAVNTIDYKGCSLYFLPEQVRTRFTTEQLQQARGLELYRLEYDVPTVRPEGVEFQHPSTYLHMVAARSTLSCWIIPKNAINSVMVRLNQLTEVGATWSIEKVDPTEVENNLNRIITAIQKEVAALVTSTEEAQERANTQLEATPEEDDPNKAVKKYTTRANATLKKNQKMLNELENVCKAFGIPGTSDWSRARASITAVEGIIQTRARLFSEAVAELRRTGGESVQVAAALESGSMPPEIAADYLQDQGKDDQAEVLREAFNENGTFSLVE